jgi:murein DD-endopeptidase MepM/ murein hydrolase activator NlpD
MRTLAAIGAAGLLLGGLLTTASGADAPARATAVAQLGGGSVGDRIPVSAEGDERRHRDANVDFPGLNIARGEVTARTRTKTGNASAQAIAVARTVSVMDGYVTAYGVRRTMTDDGEVVTAAGRVQGLKIGDQMLGDSEEPATYELPGDAGRVIVNRGNTGLRVRLTKEYRGYAAGTDIRVAVATAEAVDGDPPGETATATPEPTATPKPEAEKRGRAKKTGLQRKKAPKVPRRLTGSGFAFPVFSDQASVADDWGGPRQIGPHQGNDIFAPFGTPVLAVADGTVGKVGTLPISGNRLWLYTDGGDAFFYAHMSAFSRAAVTGKRVKAGTVLGFVGNTGDAEPTPPHLHFEVHPGGEEEDAIDPHSILLAWQQGGDVPPSAWLQTVGTDTGERPGALVEVRDFIAGE